MRNSNRPGHSITQSLDHSITGFTFIELIFVTLVLGLLLVSAVPRMRLGWTSLVTERTTFDLAQTLRSARTLAVNQAQPIEWAWDPEARRVNLNALQADGSAVPIPGRLGHSHAVPEQITLSVMQDGESVERVNFFPDGTSQTTTLLIGQTSAPRYQISLDGSTSHVTVR